MNPGVEAALDLAGRAREATAALDLPEGFSWQVDVGMADLMSSVVVRIRLPLLPPAARLDRALRATQHDQARALLGEVAAGCPSGPRVWVATITPPPRQGDLRAARDPELRWTILEGDAPCRQT